MVFIYGLLTKKKLPPDGKHTGKPWHHNKKPSKIKYETNEYWVSQASVTRGKRSVLMYCCLQWIDRTKELTLTVNNVLFPEHTDELFWNLYGRETVYSAEKCKIHYSLKSTILYMFHGTVRKRQNKMRIKVKRKGNYTISSISPIYKPHKVFESVIFKSKLKFCFIYSKVIF